MKLNINKNSEEIYNDNLGDIMSLDEFISDCKQGFFIDYDGYVGEILLDNKIINKGSLYPSDILFLRSDLKDLQEELGELYVVWYNR